MSPLPSFSSRPRHAFLTDHLLLIDWILWTLVLKETSSAFHPCVSTFLLTEAQFQPFWWWLRADLSLPSCLDTVWETPCERSSHLPDPGHKTHGLLKSFNHIQYFEAKIVLKCLWQVQYQSQSASPFTRGKLSCPNWTSNPTSNIC